MSNIDKIRQELERLKNIAENDNASEYLRGQARVCRVILSFIDSLPEEKPSEDLEEAADEYADKHGFRVPYDGSNNYYDDVDVKASKEGFLAGAEWGARHSINWRDIQLLDTFILELSREEKDGADWGDSEKFYTEVLRRFHEFNDKKIPEIVAEWEAKHLK